MLKKNSGFQHLKNQRGLAIIETLPLIIIFLILMSYSLGLYGFVHASVLHSIAARTYAFETIRNRTNVTYFRDTPGPSSSVDFTKRNYRFHSIRNPQGGDKEFVAPARRLAFVGSQSDTSGNRADVHNNRIFELSQGTRNQDIRVGPAWIMIGYGICTNVQCGD